MVRSAEARSGLNTKIRQYTVVHAPEVRQERGSRRPEEQEGGVARIGRESFCDCARAESAGNEVVAETGGEA